MIFYSIITFPYTKYFVHSYSVYVVFTFSNMIQLAIDYLFRILSVWWDASHHHLWNSCDRPIRIFGSNPSRLTSSQGGQAGWEKVVHIWSVGWNFEFSNPSFFSIITTKFWLMLHCDARLAKTICNCFHNMAVKWFILFDFKQKCFVQIILTYMVYKIKYESNKQALCPHDRQQLGININLISSVL